MQTLHTTARDPLTLPSRLARFGNQTLPDPLRRRALSLGLNRAFSEAIGQGDLNFLRSRRARILVTDIELDFGVTLSGQTLQVSMQPATADVTFRARLRDLMSIVAGRTDPDTLFFRRKLAIEGDTELGLALKNFLDSQDPEQLIPHFAYRAIQRLVR